MKKNFTLGYFQVASWCTAWAILTFVNAAGANIYRNAICDFYAIGAAPLLDAASVGGWIGGVVFLVVPMVIKRYGAKNVMNVSVLAGAVSFAAIPLSANITVIQFWIIVTGIFVGIYGISTPMVLASKWFPRKKGIIMGMISAGSILASIVFIPFFNFVLNTWDIRAAMVAFGAMMFLYGAVNVVFLKETPQECGLLPDNMEMTSADKARFEVGKRQPIPYRTALKQKKLWFIACGWGFTLIALIGLTFIAVSYMLERGISNEMAITAVAICGVIQFCMSLLSGALDQRLGPKKTALVFFLFQISGIGLVIFYHGSSAFLIMLGYWLVVGTFGTANNLASSQDLTVFGPVNYPLTYNCQAFITSMLKMLGTFIAARSLDWVGNYSLAYSAFGIALILGITCIILGGDTTLRIETKGVANE